MPKPREERVAAGLLWSGAALITAIFLGLVGELAVGGLGQLSWEFVSHDPLDAGRAGGILSIIVSTLLILGVCLLLAVPLALGTAILLSEFSPSTSRFARLTQGSLDLLACVPSIVFGLFGSAFFCKTLGLGFSILSGGLTLACMALPIMTRSMLVGFRSIPADYRLAAAALGLSRCGTLWRLLLPAAAPGIGVGLVLGIGRALAETAALIFTSGYVDRMPESLFDSGRALSVHIFDLSMNVPGGSANAYAAALVLLALLLLINACASALTQRFLGKGIVSV